jgi:hypothetical protein
MKIAVNGALQKGFSGVVLNPNNKIDINNGKTIGGTLRCL